MTENQLIEHFSHILSEELILGEDWDKANKALDSAKEELVKLGYTIKKGKWEHPSGHSIQLSSHQSEPKMTGRVRVDSTQPPVKTGFRPSTDSLTTRSLVKHGVVGYPLSKLKSHLKDIHS